MTSSSHSGKASSLMEMMCCSDIWKRWGDWSTELQMWRPKSGLASTRATCWGSWARNANQTFSKSGNLTDIKNVSMACQSSRSDPQCWLLQKWTVRQEKSWNEWANKSAKHKHSSRCDAAASWAATEAENFASDWIWSYGERGRTGCQVLFHLPLLVHLFIYHKRGQIEMQTIQDSECMTSSSGTAESQELFLQGWLQGWVHAYFITWHPVDAKDHQSICAFQESSCAGSSAMEKLLLSKTRKLDHELTSSRLRIADISGMQPGVSLTSESSRLTSGS